MILSCICGSDTGNTLHSYCNMEGSAKYLLTVVEQR
jgi:hypothetical protein